MKDAAKKGMAAVAVIMLVWCVAFVQGVQAEQKFSFNGPPAFTVVYPDDMAPDPDKPEKMLLKMKTAGSVPVLDIDCVDIPKDVALKDAGKAYMKSLEKNEETKVKINSDEMKTLPDGAPVNEIVAEWLYQGYFPLQTILVSAFKDNKWVFVAIHEVPGDPTRSIPYSLKFK